MEEGEAAAVQQRRTADSHAVEESLIPLDDVDVDHDNDDVNPALEDATTSSANGDKKITINLLGFYKVRIKVGAPVYYWASLIANVLGAVFYSKLTSFAMGIVALVLLLVWQLGEPLSLALTIITPISIYAVALLSGLQHVTSNPSDTPMILRLHTLLFVTTAVLLISINFMVALREIGEVQRDYKDRSYGYGHGYGWDYYSYDTCRYDCETCRAQNYWGAMTDQRCQQLLDSYNYMRDNSQRSRIDIPDIAFPWSMFAVMPWLFVYIVHYLYSYSMLDSVKVNMAAFACVNTINFIMNARDNYRGDKASPLLLLPLLIWLGVLALHYVVSLLVGNKGISCAMFDIRISAKKARKAPTLD